MSIELLELPSVGFATEPLPTRDGYRFTLTTLLGSLLDEAEMMFGPRDISYTPLGIEYYGDRPFVWYPGDRKHISIILTDSARMNTNQAIFQLAHEIIHLLSPTGSASAPVVEEGIAALFQQRISESYDLGVVLTAQQYIAATDLTNQLLARNPQVIRQLRSIEPSFHKWTPRFLVSETGISMKLANQLCEPFIEFETRVK